MSQAGPTLIGLRNGLADALSGQWQRIAERLPAMLGRLHKGTGSEASSVDDAVNSTTLWLLIHGLEVTAVQAPLGSGLLDGYNTAVSTVGLGAWGITADDALRYAKGRAAELVGMRRTADGRLDANPNPKWSIQDTTRHRLRAMVTDVLDEGTSYQDLKHAIEALPEFPGLFGEARAEMIARTELAIATNAGTTEAYDRAHVKLVRVLDNHACPICGPVADTIQTIDWARDPDHLLGHPHCIRAFMPIVLPTRPEDDHA